MYIDQEAEGENYGTITGNGDNLKGVVVANQGKFKTMVQFKLPEIKV